MASETGPEHDVPPNRGRRHSPLLAFTGVAVVLAAGGLVWAWRAGLLSRQATTPTPLPSRQRALAYLRHSYPPDWLLKVHWHSDDFGWVVVWAGPPASEFVEEVELEWRDGSYRVRRARALTYEAFSGPDPIAAVQACPTYAATPQTTYRVVRQEAGEATVVVEGPEADPPHVEVYVERVGDEWQVVGDDLGGLEGDRR